MDREAWHAAIHGAAKSWTDWATELELDGYNWKWRVASQGWRVLTPPLQSAVSVLLSSFQPYPSFSAHIFWVQCQALSLIRASGLSVLLFLCKYFWPTPPLQRKVHWNNFITEICQVILHICISLIISEAMSDSLRPHRLYSPRNSPGQNTGVGSLSLLQGIFPNQGLNQVSCIAGGFFTSWATREAPIISDAEGFFFLFHVLYVHIYAFFREISI